LGEGTATVVACCGGKQKAKGARPLCLLRLLLITLASYFLPPASLPATVLAGDHGHLQARERERKKKRSSAHKTDVFA